MMTSKMRKSPDFFKKVTRMTVKMRKKNMIRSTKRKIKTKKMRMLMMKMAKKVTTSWMRKMTWNAISEMSILTTRD
jgi:hypothetical protein|tara:strand:+ start:275 stop:502 length:228 start_codon:yes stop_codon:yes gene_type:complete